MLPCGGCRVRIIVTGGRDYADQNAVARTLQALWNPLQPGKPTLVHGGAPGADQIAHQYARAHGWEVEVHYANWELHGRGAGPIRNQKMANAGGDLCIAFPGGRGTADMVRRAEEAGIPVRHITGKKTDRA